MEDQVMGADTKIQWATHTFNPWIGCTAESAGCLHCYGKAWAKRAGRDFSQRRRTSEAYWRQPLKWNEAAAAAGGQVGVFSGSLCDIFDDDVSIPLEWRTDLWKTIAATASVDWLLLTKRPENWPSYLPQAQGWHWTNVRLGVTIENRDAFEARAEALFATHRFGWRTFVSFEPAIEPVAFTGLMPAIGWLIVGGESGPDARPCDLAWIADAIAQGRAAGKPVFVKQLGSAWAKATGARHPKGGDPAEWPEELRVREFPRAE
jgi:protein gp37